MDLLTPAQVRLVVRRSLRRIADMAIPKRRQRACPRALRQPVSSWPRLRKNTYRNGVREYLVWLVAEARLDWFCPEDDDYRPQLPDAQGCTARSGKDWRI